MDGELLRWLYHRLLCPATRTPRCRYPDGLIALAGLWAYLNNRSARWAADAGHWPLWCRRPLPSYSQLRRRLPGGRVRRLTEQVNEQLKARLGRSGERAADGMPLVVGGFGRDPEATRGRVPGGWARGYRTHAVRDTASGVIDAAVSGLHAGEATVLRTRLLDRVPLGGCLLRADANYDSNALYAAVAERGGRLIAPRRKPGRGLGHHRQHPDRLRVVREVEPDPQARREHRRCRNDIERGFADLGQSVGLFALPPFVRRLRRVEQWVAAKLLLYHLVLLLRREKT